VKTACKEMNYQSGFSVSDTLYSVAIPDGWVLESSELSNLGGSLNTSFTSFSLGDDALDRQFRAILSFNTAALPDDAVITKVTLKVKKLPGLVGSNPFVTHGNILVDIRKGPFSSNAALQTIDFQATRQAAIGTIKDGGQAGMANLLTTGLPYVNKAASPSSACPTKDDNDDQRGPEFYSGNAPAAYRPVLVITYHRPLSYPVPGISSPASFRRWYCACLGDATHQ
jgi:hypothetical protein